MRILLVEDHPKMQAAVKKGLGEQGYVVEVVGTGREGEELASIETFDLIILDVMLPDRDGTDVCKNLRRREVTTPIMMLTALSGTEDKVTGLDAGADDYLTKPFEFSELHARVRALLRRGEASESARLRYEDIEMDLAAREVTRGDDEIRLTQKEFALLEYLLRNPNKVLSRSDIGEHVWDMNFDPFSNVIDVYISMLRKKLEATGKPRIIQTVIGSGYVLSSKERS